MEITESANQWSLLPHDILHKILEKLWFLDRVRAVATCKNWNVPIPAISKYLPWLIEQDWSFVPGSNGRQKLSCKLNLYEALSPKVYPPTCRIFDLGRKRERIIHKAATVFRNCVQRPSVEVLHTKLGWVLVMIRMSCPKQKKKSSSSYSFLVLYNPFVQSFRFLPALEFSDIDMMAAFSRPPTSSDCVVYAVIKEYYRRPFLRIHSYRPCDDRTKWKVETYIIHYDEHMAFKSSVVMEDGTFYCLGYKLDSGGDFYSSKERSLIAFNSSNLIKQKNNPIKLQTEPLVGLDDDLDIVEEQLAEHEGELFLVCCCRSSSTWDKSLWYHMIYWYNKSANCWSFKQRLDHRKSFVNDDDESCKSAALVTTPGHLLAVQIGNVWEMGGRFWCFEHRPNGSAIEKLFPSYHLDFSDSEDSDDDDDVLNLGKVMLVPELQWLSLGQALAPPLHGATLSTINGSQSDSLSTINGSKWNKPP